MKPKDAILHQAYASCPKHLELLLKDELITLGAENVAEKLSGVVFYASAEVLMRSLLWSRLANRILVLINQIKVNDAKELYDAIYQTDWLDQVNITPRTLAINFKGTNKELRNTQYSSQVVKDAICDRIREVINTRPDIVKSNADLSVSVVLKNKQILVYQDISGRSLHLRGYRQSLTAAPLKENLAAAVLIRANWPELSKLNHNLIDPMCGSGTFLTEGYLIACDIAPGLTNPRYCVDNWRYFDEDTWNELLFEAKTRMIAGVDNFKGQIIGADHHKDSVKITEEHAYQLNAEDKIQCQYKTFENFSIPAKNNLIVCNPPYGVRLKKNVDATWRQLGQWMADKALGSKAAIMTHAKNQGFLLGFRATKSWKLMNGDLLITLITFDIDSNAKLNAPQGQKHALPETAQMVANRIKKNLAKLKKWINKEGINCYRVYDADIPEYAVAIDVYNNHINIQEYKAPKTIPEKKTKKRLEDAVLGAQVALNIKNDKVHIKTRQKQASNNQYERRVVDSADMVVHEQDRKYLVNLEKYLDTGLFLDHRWIRSYIQENSRGKSMLNLFSYTGSVTVAAVIGGATKTTSVDSSKTYLNWAKENFKINRVDLYKHKLIRNDVLEYLSSCSHKFDIIFVDPPTYSNSHSRETDWDVQRDHKQMLLACKRVLSPQGEIIFSNNYRKFVLDANLSDYFSIKDLTKQSVSPDFIKSKIKRVCYQLKLI
ncbi:MAG: bifunctional 23S rRNA (guanine(2069)-N(7))-methyltransferase RlmK/23S rRNA (guanine(2445)-N(2))-methyltransferase RlmL [Alcanivoracaceae bacterium]|nr:bifunctional 23S rRNA (guanine(2069)-N(7))-methyltransferase RlmK/23S rRNA (guanine(2445)-N(2))-methyltransferase RlmL [Alcanivoracaceae bacterium]